MIYDETISSDVSLSKILDYFILEEETPSVIIQFLESHSDSSAELHEILRYSIYHERLFQLDFISRCSLNDVLDFYRLITKLPNYFIRLGFYLSWQILSSDSSEIIKNIFHKFISKLSYSHPYSGFIGREISKYDNVFKCYGESIHSITSKINEYISDKDFNNYMEGLDRSLWFGRMLQSDFFLGLNVQKQYIFIHNLSKSNKVSYLSLINFLRQIIDIDLNPEIKYEILNIVCSSSLNINFCYNIEGNVKNILDKGKTYPEIAIPLQLYGLENITSDIILYLICKGRLDMIFSIYENEPELIKEHFDISDVLDYMKKNEADTNRT